MKDPIRLLEDDGGASARERDVLRAGRAEGPTPREKQALWTAIAAQTTLAIPAAAAQSAPTVASAGVTSTGGASLVIKGTLVALALGGGVFTATRAWHPAPQPPPATAVTAPVTAAPPPAPTEATPPSTPPPAPRPAAVRAARPQTARAVLPREPSPSRLAAEGRAVVEAKRALRAGDAKAALRLLETAARAFPHGALGQEREALAIEALDRTGQHDAARARADAFLLANPTSPHATNVRRFAGER